MNFYQKLPSFDDFSDLTDDRHFTRVPDDWVIVIADIKGSTNAIKDGRYRDVNTLGVASIVVVQEFLGEGAFPFVFGGDGAGMLIPPESKEAVSRRLFALIELAEQRFQLSMRIGFVPVDALTGVCVEVAKFRIAGSRCLAMFRGGGMAQAEHLVKTREECYGIGPCEAVDLNLSRLSCRWQPIPPKRDCSMVLMVRSRTGHDGYGKVLEAIRGLYDGRIESADPVNLGAARYRSIRECLRDEMRYHRSWWSMRFLWRVMEITLAVLVFRHGMPAPFRAGDYAASMGRHSDYRKFDDMLRMVIDCSEAQADEIRRYLESLLQAGDIYYGIHVSPVTLMTCFFHGPGEGDHIHFIDGGDGGYALAAMNLKKQIEAS